jgi:hypothetical protein
MAIAAPDCALVDLDLDVRPGETTKQHVRHVSPFVAEMVELENDGVRLATVHTPMLAEVIPCAFLILSF